ncbi:MAG: hypothetical protein ABIR81_11300 [Ginsengibacter sp.]
MKHSSQIEQELYDAAPTLAKAGKENVFIIQDNYFNLLSDRILERVTATSVYSLATSETVFTTPENYFSKLPGQVMARIKELDNIENHNVRKEIEELSPLLASLQDKNVFTVGSEYFSTFNVITKTEAPVVKMQVFNKFWKYAAAAAIAGIMATSALLVEDHNVKPINGVITSELRLAKTFKSSAQLTKAINELSADDISTYLDQSSTTGDESDLANSVIEKELPSSADYLIDENTLNNYLKKIDVKSTNN